MLDIKSALTTRRVVAMLAAAAAVVGITLIAVRPYELDTNSLRSAIAEAKAGDTATLVAPVRLLAPISLDKGTRIEVSAHVDGAGTEPTDADRSNSAPHLTIKNAKLIIDQSPDRSLRTRATTTKEANPTTYRRLIDTIQDLKFAELSFIETLVKLRRPGGKVKPIATVNARLKHDVDGKRPLRLEGTVTYARRILIVSASFETPGDDSKTLSFNAEIDGTDFKISMSGKLSTHDGFQITAFPATFQSNDFKSVLNWLGMGPIKSNGLREFQAKGRLDWRETTLAFEQSEFTLEGNKATGRLSFFFDDREPSVEGTLAFESLDLKRLLVTPQESQSDSLPEQLWSGFLDTVSKNELPFGLKYIDTDLRVSSKALQYDSVTLGEGAGVIVTKDGQFKADLADVRLSSGTTGRAKIAINVDEFVPSYVVRGNLEKLDLSHLSQSWTKVPALDGLADLTFDLTSHGRSTKRILRTISGQMTLSAPGGASLPINLNKVFGQQAPGTPSPLATFGTGFSALDNVALQLTMKNGVIKTKSAKAKLGRDVLNASGTFRLHDVMLNLILTRLHVKAADAAEKTENSVQIYGPITEPEVKVLTGSKKS